MKRRTTIRAVIKAMPMGLAALTLAACQHTPSERAQGSPDVWRVMERVGSIRTTAPDGLELPGLRPGEAITHGSFVATDRSSFLIIARDGMQLTLDESTSLTLPAADAPPKFTVDRGELRLRLATAANRSARILTHRFDITAAHATIVLSVAAGTADLSVEDGSAVLTTTDGRHRASLVAGAAARIDGASSDDLLIRKASGEPFTRSVPLAAETSGDDGTPVASSVRSRSTAMNAPTATNPPIAPAAADREWAKDSIIGPPPERSGATGTIGADDVPSGPAKGRMHDRKAIGDIDVPRIIPASRLIAPSTVEKRTAERPPPATVNLRVPEVRARFDKPFERDRTIRPAAGERPAWTAADPLEVKFDRLTQGLLEGIPRRSQKRRW